MSSRESDKDVLQHKNWSQTKTCCGTKIELLNCIDILYK
jgi:hypothetical protein